jgi:hypothetical protein
MKEGYISDFTLERYLFRELPEKQIIEIDNLCSRDPDLKNRIEKIRNENAEILNKYPEEDIVAEIKRRYEIQQLEYEKKSSVSRPIRRCIMFPSLIAAAGFYYHTACN